MSQASFPSNRPTPSGDLQASLQNPTTQEVDRVIALCNEANTSLASWQAEVSTLSSDLPLWQQQVQSDTQTLSSLQSTISAQTEQLKDDAASLDLLVDDMEKINKKALSIQEELLTTQDLQEMKLLETELGLLSSAANEVTAKLQPLLDDITATFSSLTANLQQSQNLESTLAHTNEEIQTAQIALPILQSLIDKTQQLQPEVVKWLAKLPSDLQQEVSLHGDATLQNAVSQESAHLAATASLATSSSLLSSQTLSHQQDLFAQQKAQEETLRNLRRQERKDNLSQTLTNAEEDKKSRAKSHRQHALQAHLAAQCERLALLHQNLSPDLTTTLNNLTATLSPPSTPFKPRLRLDG